MRRVDLRLVWPGVSARLGVFGVQEAESRLTPQIRRVHQSRCARALALELLDAQGVIADAIPKGAAGQPVWPEDSVGSLAHTGGFAVAAVARKNNCLALGIDVEPARPLPADSARLVLRDEEREWAESAGRAEPCAGRLIFCAKECVHKAIHPLRGAWLDFDEVRIDVDPALDRFVPRPVSPAAKAAFSGTRAEGLFLRVEGQLVAVLALFATVQ